MYVCSYVVLKLGSLKFEIYHLVFNSEPEKYFGVGWNYYVNTDGIREFYLVKKKNYTLMDIMNLTLQNKFYR
jgi:hypothetical protein